MGKRDEHFIMILDIDRVFSTDELAIVQDAGSYEQSENPEETEHK
jgi:purine-binding chemotaxis protein CheW